MKRFVIPALIILAFVLETKVRVMGIGPSLSVMLVYFVGLRYGHLKGLGFGVAVGALADAVSGSYLGPSLLGKATVGYLAQYLRKGLFIWTPVLGVIGLAAFTAIDALISYLCNVLFFETPATIARAATIIITQALFNAVFGLFITPGEEDPDAEP